MLRATPTLHKMSSTHGGMRRILKKRLPVQKYIELAVKSGSYKSPSTRPNFLGLHDVPEPKGYIHPREREERLKLARGIIDFPTEYEILSLNPPLPDPPKTPVRIRKKILADKRRHLQRLKKEQKKKGLNPDDILPKELPSMDRLVRGYLRRHEDKLSSGVSPSQSRQTEEYYNNLLLGGSAGSGDPVNDKLAAQKQFLSPSSLQTAMGRKSMLVENAYAFALKQQQVMMEGGDVKEGESITSSVMTENESVEKVEQLLREESRADRHKGSKTAGDIDEWRTGQDASDGEKKKDDTTTLPSILHDRPRAIRALNIWSTRLQSIPYSRWTIGASTALDHWIAREVLQMEEMAWQQVLEGGGTDAYVIDGDMLQGGESKRGLMDRMRDIVLVRGALFPETQLESGGLGGRGDELVGDLEPDLLEGDSNATEKSIDELLASLGELDDDDDGSSWKFDDEDDKKEDVQDDGVADEKMAAIMDELQVWRRRNESSPYDAWDGDRKSEFDQWIEKYVSILYPEADAGTVDKEATRNSLLSERPTDSSKTKEFWNNVRTQSEAELFLQDYRAAAQDRLNSMDEAHSLTDEGVKMQTELEMILSVSFDVQLEKIVDMGTLRPILDDYAPGKERTTFLEKYAPIFLEGLEMEHLVPDPDGPIGVDDLSSDMRDELSAEWTTSSGLAAADGSEPRFAIQMVAHGTDEFGTARAERARALYQLWNEHKANRARFEESLFKKGYLPLRENGIRIKRKPTKDKKK